MNQLIHYGIPGQEWGVKNGPPYPLSYEKSSMVRMKAYNKPDESIEFTKNKLKGYRNDKGFSELERIKSSDSDEEVLDNICKDLSGFDLYNCQNCSVAFDFVRRGYKVKAKPRREGSNVGDIESYYKGGKLNRVGVDVSGDVRNKLHSLNAEYDAVVKRMSSGRMTYEEFAGNIADLNERSRRIHDGLFNESIDNCKKEILSFGSNSRGTLVVGWNMSQDLADRTRYYHAFNFETVDGKIKFYDTQSHRDWKKYGDPGLSSFVDGMDPRELYVMRTDNLELSEKALEAIY